MVQKSVAPQNRLEYFECRNFFCRARLFTSSIIREWSNHLPNGGWCLVCLMRCRLLRCSFAASGRADRLAPDVLDHWWQGLGGCHLGHQMANGPDDEDRKIPTGFPKRCEFFQATFFWMVEDKMNEARHPFQSSPGIWRYSDGRTLIFRKEACPESTSPST